MLDAYVISLKQPDTLLNTIKSYNLRPILSKGVIGKNISEEKLKRHNSFLWSKIGPKSAIGCGMAHMNTWKKFVKSGKDSCIIFEDDVIFEDNFEENLKNAIDNIPADFDIFYLGCFGSLSDTDFFTYYARSINIIAPEKEIDNDYMISPRVSVALHGYMLSRKGAKKLISLLDGFISNHIDVCIQGLISSGDLTVYSASPRLVYQTSTDGTISNNVSNKHPYLINSYLSNFYVDKGVKLSYVTTVSGMRVGDLSGTFSTGVLFIIGGLLSRNIDIYTASLIFGLISLGDRDIKHTLLHYILYISWFIPNTITA